jgi:hypothetical protein
LEHCTSIADWWEAAVKTVPKEKIQKKAMAYAFMSRGICGKNGTGGYSKIRAQRLYR